MYNLMVPGISPLVTVTAVTGTATLTAADKIITVNPTSAAFTLSLPALASVLGKVYEITNIGTNLNLCTIDPNASETISGAATTTLATPGEAIRIYATATDWRILSRYIPSVLPAVTVTGTWSTNTTYTAKARRFQDTAYFEVKVTLAGAPDSIDLEVTLPTGYVIDTTKMNFATLSGRQLLEGACQAVDTGSAAYPGFMVSSSTTAVAPRVILGSALADVTLDSNGITQAVPITFGNTDVVFLRFQFPVVGWGC